MRKDDGLHMNDNRYARRKVIVQEMYKLGQNAQNAQNKNYNKDDLSKLYNKLQISRIYSIVREVVTSCTANA
jgi:hypothetical protein